MYEPKDIDGRTISETLAPTGIAPEHSWRIRFWTIFVGQTLSLVGSSLTQFVLLWWIADTTGSASALATAGMALLLPQAVLGPLGGAFADRYSRRMLMIVADSVSAVCMLVLMTLFLSERVELWHIYVTISIRSAAQAFQTPAAMASVSMLVPTDFLIRAAGFNQTLQSLSTVAAAPLGAFAITVMPVGWALSIDISTAVLGILPLIFFDVPQVRRSKSDPSHLLKELNEGVQLVWNEPCLRQLYGLIGAVVLIVMPAHILAPLLVKEHFDGGAPQVALMESLSGIGMVIGGMAMAVLAPCQKIPWILGGLAASCLAMALTGFTPSGLFGIAVAWWVISGLAFVLGNAPLTALLQSSIPNHLQGRALSLLTTVMGLAAPIGLALITPIGRHIGVNHLFALAGVLGAAVCLSGFFARALRNMDTPNGNESAPKQ